MPIFALWQADDKFCIRTADGIVQTPEMQAVIQMAQDDTVVLFDLKKLLRHHAEFSVVPLQNCFDVKLAGALCSAHSDSDSALDLAKKNGFARPCR